MRHRESLGLPGLLLISMGGLLGFTGVVYANPKTAGDAYQIVDKTGNLVRTLHESHSLPAGKFGLKAHIQLPSANVDKVRKRIPLKMMAEPSPGQSRPTKPSRVIGFAGAQKSHPNLLDADELWITYRSKPGDGPCQLSGQLEAHPMPFGSSEQATAITKTTRVQLGYNKQNRTFINLDNGPALPRTLKYIIQEQTGKYRTERWQLVTRNNARTYERPLHLDLKDIDQITLVMDPAITTVNMRISYLRSGEPTYEQDWEQIPKTIYTRNGLRVVVFHMGRLIRENLHQYKIVQLVELIAHSSLDTAGSPIKSLTATYDKAKNFQKNTASAFSERIGPDLWRWRIDLQSLQERDLVSLDLLKGKVTDQGGKCTQGFERAELVQLGVRKIPSVYASTRNKIQNWGGPFENPIPNHSKMIEWPRILADLPMSIFAGDENGSDLAGANHRIPDLLGLTIKPEDRLATDTDTGVLTLAGQGKTALTWKTAVKLPRHAFIFVKTATESTPRAEVTLHFADGRSETVHSKLGNALDLSRFAGKTLNYVEWQFSLPKNGRLPISELVLFKIDTATPSQALTLPQAKWSWKAPSTIWLHNDAHTGEMSGELDQTINSNLANLAAIRIKYKLSSPPLKPGWLRLTIEGKGHTESMRLYPAGEIFSKHGKPAGIKGSLLISKHGKIFGSLEPNAFIDKAHWSIVRGALPAGDTVLLQADAASLNSAPIADRMLSSFNIQVAGRSYTPRPATKFWQGLASSGHAWLGFGEVDWPGGVMSIEQPELNSSPGNFGEVDWPGGVMSIEQPERNSSLGEITQWRMNYKTSLDKNLLDQPNTSPTAVNTNHPSMLKTKLALLLLILWGILLFRRRAIQRKTSTLWEGLLTFVNGSGQAIHLWAKETRDFIVAERHVLNVLATILAWLAWIAPWKAYWEHPSTPIDWLALVLIAFFALLHEWRWQQPLNYQTTTNKHVRRWFLGGKRVPPLIILALSIFVLFYRGMGTPLVMSIMAIANVKSYGILGWLALDRVYHNPKVLIAGLGVLASPLKESTPLSIALLYGILPWILEWGYWLTTPSARFARWLSVMLPIYGLGFMRIAQVRTNDYLLIGTLVATMAWYVWLLQNRPWLESRWPSIAAKIYGSNGSIYFSVALISLVLASTFSVFKIKVLSELFALQTYYACAMGAIMEMASLVKEKTRTSN